MSSILSWRLRRSTKRFCRHSKQMLEPGESVLAACGVEPIGYSRAFAWLTPGLLAPPMTVRPSTGLAARLPTCVVWLAISDQRFLAMSVTPAMGRPDELLAEYPLSAVARISARRMRAIKLVEIEFSDGSVAMYEARFHSPIAQLGGFVGVGPDGSR